MSSSLRIVLLVAPILVAAYTIRRIRKSRILIEDSVFWIIFSFVVVLLGIFPGIATTAARILGIQSPANLVFLVMTSLMIWKVFSLTNKISMLEAKLRQFAEQYAIHEKKENEQP